MRAPERAAVVTKLVLASASPRRAALLDQLGVRYRVIAPAIDESVMAGETPHDYVRRIALAKADSVCTALERRQPVLAADTAVVACGRILGKPRDADDARDMLGLLSAAWHEVFSGVALVQRTASVIAVRTRVKFRALTASEIDRYWDSGEGADKAGAYAIQGLGGAFVERIEGSYSNVVGLPLAETLALLEHYPIAHALAPR